MCLDINKDDASPFKKKTRIMLCPKGKKKKQL